MKSSHSFSLLACLIVVLLTWPGRVVAHAQAQINQPSLEQVNPDPWPKSAQVNGAKYTLYEPQLESWDGYNLVGHAAVSVQPSGAKYPAFGATYMSSVDGRDNVKKARSLSPPSVALRRIGVFFAKTQIVRIFNNFVCHLPNRKSWSL